VARALGLATLLGLSGLEVAIWVLAPPLQQPLRPQGALGPAQVALAGPSLPSLPPPSAWLSPSPEASPLQVLSQQLPLLFHWPGSPSPLPSPGLGASTPPPPNSPPASPTPSASPSPLPSPLPTPIPSPSPQASPSPHPTPPPHPSPTPHPSPSPQP
jgi:hypothetical protein